METPMVRGDVPEHLNRVTGAVIDAAVKVHRAFGPGLREWVYRDALCIELRMRGIACEREVRLDTYYEGERMQGAIQLDLLVEGAVIVELKAVEEVHPTHYAQIRSYLKLTGVEVGLLMNFGAVRLVEGLHRVVMTAPRPPDLRDSA